MSEDTIRVNDMVRGMGEITLSMFEDSFTSLKEGDTSIYERVEKAYAKLRDCYEKCETEILELLVGSDPDASEARKLAAFFKASVYFERIGKYAELITSGSVALYGDRSIGTIDAVSKISFVNIRMLRGILDAMRTYDISPLYGYGELFYEVESGRDAVLREAADFIRMSPETADSRIHYVAISRHIERIADDICRLSEELIFMDTGERVRLN